MIRDKNKTYGEPNHENTAIVNNQLIVNRLVIGSGGNNPKLSTLPIYNRAIPYINKNNKPSKLDLNKPNSYIGTGEDGNLTLISKKTLPIEPPLGREELSIVIGTLIPDGPIGRVEIPLEAGYWYEIEIIGAGGGGGAGAISDVYLQSSLDGDLDGGDGGMGGYYKGFFSLSMNTLAILEAGCSGGKGYGHTITRLNGNLVINSPTRTVTSNGGDGGRSPIYLDNVGVKGADSIFGVVGNRPGGNGRNNGANGGSVMGGYELEPAPGNCGAAGGGGNGQYGGAGGRCYNTYDLNGNPELHHNGPGAGGGAGGGLGLGGSGGSALTPNQDVIKYGGLSYGGGGGGHGSIYVDELGVLIYHLYSAGAGGGGGASYFKCGDIEIICGGGGGGASGKSSYTGTSGNNNQNIQIGGGGAPGIGGKGIGKPEVLNNKYYVTDGTNGSPGRIRLWKCVE